MPYMGVSSFCSSKKTATAQNIVGDYEMCESCTETNWRSLIAKGPIVVAIDADDLSNYKPTNNSPWVPAKCGQVNHAVTAVGIETVNGEDIIIVKNSWGTSWGINGYFRVSVKNHCGILVNAFLPVVQQHKPFTPRVGSTFSNKCDSTGKTTMVFDGVSDLTKTLVTGAQSFKKASDKETYWNFFYEKNCGGKAQWYWDSVCFATDSTFEKGKPILSAVRTHMLVPTGCFMNYESSCFEGGQMLVCANVADMAKVGLTLNLGSIFVNSFSVLSVTFYSETDYNGVAYGLKFSKDAYANFNISANAALRNAMATAKSVAVVRAPGS